MKARDGDAQMKWTQGGNAPRAGAKSGRDMRVCPSCRTEVAVKTGFRLSSTKCTKCGAALGRR
jgi:hydrogenase maturation factor HypF (carbamoyltransferase family)